MNMVFFGSLILLFALILYVRVRNGQREIDRQRRQAAMARAQAARIPDIRNYGKNRRFTHE